MDQPVESDILSEMTEEELESSLNQQPMSRFIRFDLKYLFPLFTHQFSRRELRDCRNQMTSLANQWYQAVRLPSSQSDEDIDYWSRQSFKNI